MYKQLGKFFGLFGCLALAGGCGVSGDPVESGQQQQTVTSLLAMLPADRAERLSPASSPGGPVTIAPLVDIVAGRAVLDVEHLRKQPDWSYAAEDSGTTPAARYANTAVSVRPRHTDLATGSDSPQREAVDPDPGELVAQVERRERLRAPDDGLLACRREQGAGEVDLAGDRVFAEEQPSRPARPVGARPRARAGRSPRSASSGSSPSASGTAPHGTARQWRG